MTARSVRPIRYAPYDSRPMTITQIGSPAADAGLLGSWSATIDYDDTAKTIAITPTGTGHATLTLSDNTGPSAIPLDAVDCDQYANDEQRHIVAGPGAAGLDINGQPLPTNPIVGNIVGRFNPPKGQPPSLAIGVDWHP